MTKAIFFSGFNKKGVFFVCLHSILLFTTNASADLYSFNLIYASKDLNGGAIDNYATVTVNLTAENKATITFDRLDSYILQTRLGVQLNAFLYGVSTWTDGSFVNQKNFSEFGDMNISFDRIGTKLASFSFDITNKATTAVDYWTDATQVLIINDKGYTAVAHIVPQQGNSGYAAGNGSAVPLPGAIWLLGSGLVGLVAIRRRRTA